MPAEDSGGKRPTGETRILFLGTGLGRLRHFHSVIAAFDRQRCYTVLATDDAYRSKQPERFLGDRRLLDLVVHPHHDLDAHPGFVAMSGLRNALNYRFFAEWIGSERLAARIETLADPATVARTRRRFARFPQFRDWMRRFEETTPAATVARRFVARHRPHAVVVSPLLHFLNHHQVEYAKAAKQLGVPLIYAINSWDNVTTKGDLFVVPDRTYVWNEFQAEEMTRFLGVEKQTVDVIGAWRMEPFLALSPSDGRAGLLRTRGLDPERRTLIYLCSSELAGDEESAFVLDWMQAVAAQFPEGRRPNLIVRPHPRRPLDLATLRRLWGANAYISVGSQLLDEQDLYDELWASDAAVGVNTSAILQAVALGKPVLLPQCSAVADMHAGLPHAQFLTRPTDGLLEMAPDMGTHARDLAALLRGESGDRGQRLARLSADVIGCGSRSASRSFCAQVVRHAEELGGRNAVRNRAPFPEPGDWGRVFREAGRLGVRALDSRPLADPGRRWASALLTEALEAADARNPEWRLSLFVGEPRPADPGLRTIAALSYAAPGHRAARLLSRLAPRWAALRSLADALADAVLKDAGSRETYELTRARWMTWYPQKARTVAPGRSASHRSDAGQAELGKAPSSG